MAMCMDDAPDGHSSGGSLSLCDQRPDDLSLVESGRFKDQIKLARKTVGGLGGGGVEERKRQHRDSCSLCRPLIYTCVMDDGAKSTLANS